MFYKIIKKKEEKMIKKIKNIIAFILVPWISIGFLYAGTEISWIDNNNTVHKNSFVSESAVKSMMVSTGVQLKKLRDTRIIIKQGWGCLSVINYRKEDYKIIDSNTAVLYIGFEDFVGASVECVADSEKSFFILGERGCKLLNNSEHWTVEQKINGSWIAVASGVFTYIK